MYSIVLGSKLERNYESLESGRRKSRAAGRAWCPILDTRIFWSVKRQSDAIMDIHQRICIAI